MKQKQLPRLLIGATGSGCGKTTFTCGLLQALLEQGRTPLAFKCGPDYIDPMFHTEVLGVKSKNLDLYFTDKSGVNSLLGEAESDIAVIEGVMGYYDGLAGISTEASAYDLADKTKTPAVLLVDARGRSVSLLAEIKGFLEYKDQSHIKGIILNQVSPMFYPELKRLVEDNLPVTVYGYLPRMEECSLESRHLGLVTAAEIDNLRQIVKMLSRQIKESVDLNGLLTLAESAEPVLYEQRQSIFLDAPVRIGIARDKAFCFYYEENLDLLRRMGVELVPFSPLEEAELPCGIKGLILGGGYPELYLEQLSSNRTMMSRIKEAIHNGIPCLAECGGFMYLQEELKDADGKGYPVVGAIEGSSFPKKKLGRFGYIELTAKGDNLLCEKGQQLRGHEFHYWDSSNTGQDFTAEKPLRNTKWDCIVCHKNLLAGYPHFYLTEAAAKRFVDACIG